MLTSLKSNTDFCHTDFCIPTSVSAHGILNNMLHTVKEGGKGGGGGSFSVCMFICVIPCVSVFVWFSVCVNCL